MHPLLNLIATRPQLLAEHAQAYAELMAAEMPRAATVLKRQALLNGLALLGLHSAVMLAGVAVMLWAVLVPQSMTAAWLLIAVPSMPAVGAIACLIAAQGHSERHTFGTLGQQVSADLRMLREATAQ